MKLKKAQKTAIYLTSLFVGVSVYLGAYSFFSSSLTEEQRQERISLKNESGLAVLKAVADSASVAGISMGLCASLMFFRAKRTMAKAEK